MFGLNVSLTSLLEELQLILFFETVPFPCFRLFLKKFRLRCCVDNQFHSPACFWLALVKAGSLMRLTSYWKLFTLLVNHWIKKQELKLFLSRRDLKSCLNCVGRGSWSQPKIPRLFAILCRTPRIPTNLRGKFVALSTFPRAMAAPQPKFSTIQNKWARWQAVWWEGTLSRVIKVYHNCVKE